MALISSIIESGLVTLFTTKIEDPQVACDAFANIYQAYAATALAGVVPPVFTGTERTRFSATLFAAVGVAPPGGSPATAAAAFVAAVTAFWLAPPVIFGAGAVTAFPGAPVLLATLTAMFGTFHTEADAAAQMAAALDAATRTVTVVIGPTTLTLT